MPLLPTLLLPALSLLYLSCLTVTSAQYDTLNSRNSADSLMAGPLNAGAQMSSADIPGLVDNIVAKSRLDPVSKANNTELEPANSASKTGNPNVNVIESIGVKNDTVRKSLQLELRAGNQKAKNNEAIANVGELGKQGDVNSGESIIESRINKVSRISNTKAVSDDLIKEAVLTKKWSETEDLYNLTNELIRILNIEYNGLAQNPEDNDNSIAYTFSLTQYFNLELVRIWTSESNSYDDAHRKALANVRKMRDATAIQLAAPVRRTLDIFRSIIATPVEIVQAICTASTPNCDELYRQKLIKEIKRCPNIVYNTYVFINVLSKTDANKAQVKEAANINLGTQIKRLIKRSNGKSKRHSRRKYAKRNADSHHIRHKRDQVENKAVLPIPQVVGNVAGAVKTVAEDHKYVVKTVDGIAQRIIEVPKSIIGRFDGLLDVPKRKRSVDGSLTNAERSGNVKPMDSNVISNVNTVNSIPGNNDTKPAVSIADTKIVEPETAIEKDVTDKTTLGKLFNYTLLKIEASMQKNKIILENRAMVYGLVKQFQEWNKFTCFDIARNPALDEPLALK